MIVPIDEVLKQWNQIAMDFSAKAFHSPNIQITDIDQPMMQFQHSVVKVVAAINDRHCLFGYPEGILSLNRHKSFQDLSDLGRLLDVRKAPDSSWSFQWTSGLFPGFSQMFFGKTVSSNHSSNKESGKFGIFVFISPWWHSSFSMAFNTFYSHPIKKKSALTTYYISRPFLWMP